MPVTPDMLRKEEGCFAITAERKYYHIGGTFIKRSLRPHEWQTSPFKGTIHIPRQDKQRILNEGACLTFIRANTNIPVPEVYACFEDDYAVYVIMRYVEGVGMNELNDEQRKIVKMELEGHLQTLRGLRSCQIGGPSGLIVPPYRVTLNSYLDKWNLKNVDEDDQMTEDNTLVFCHNDLSQQNVIVDPKSLKIAAIIDWEYAGFYPAFEESRFYERLGPSVASDGEEDDTERLLGYLQSQQKL